MSYTIDQLELDIDGIIAELRQLRADKGHDYSGTDDTMDNLREFGSQGVLVRIGDKFKRLKHFYKQGVLSVADEKIEDTMQDLVNYALYLLIMRRQETQSQQCAPQPSNRKLRVYLAAAVRGPMGDAASEKRVNANIVDGIAYANLIRKQLPDAEVYCPHEHEQRYQQAWRQGLFTSEDVLNQCLAMVRMSDVVAVCSDPKWSGGVKMEMDEADRHGIPVADVWWLESHKWGKSINEAVTTNEENQQCQES